MASLVKVTIEMEPALHAALCRRAAQQALTPEEAAAEVLRGALASEGGPAAERPLAELIQEHHARHQRAGPRSSSSR